MEEAPGEGAGFVEELESDIGSTGIDGACLDEELRVGVDFLRRSVGDSPVVVAVPTGSTVAFGEIRGYRRRRSNDLIGDGLQRRRHPHSE